MPNMHTNTLLMGSNTWITYCSQHFLCLDGTNPVLSRLVSHLHDKCLHQRRKYISQLGHLCPLSLLEGTGLCQTSVLLRHAVVSDGI